MGGTETRWGFRWLLAVAIRRGRFSVWQARAQLHRQVILLAYPGVRCARGVWIDPSAHVAATDGGTIEIGPGTEIAPRAIIVAEGGALRIGGGCHIGMGTTIHAKAAIDIGDDSLIAQYVVIRDHDHETADPARPYRVQGFVTSPVWIGRDTWLGAKVTVLKGSSVGDDAVVGANAVVTHSIPPGMIAVGIPARPFRRVHP